MDRMRKILRFSAIILIVSGGSACVQQASSGPLSAEGQAQSVFTRLAGQSTRIAALETANADLAAELARQEDFLSYLATRVPAGRPIPRGATRTPIDEFEGGLSIEGGRCCVGAIAGQELSIAVEFNARSPIAGVTDMRVAYGLGSLDPGAIERAEWQPFVETMTFEVTPPINWIGFYVAVQYRDAAGNLSRVFRAEISVEGAPPYPTESPDT